MGSMADELRRRKPLNEMIAEADGNYWDLRCDGAWGCGS